MIRLSKILVSCIIAACFMACSEEHQAIVSNTNNLKDIFVNADGSSTSVTQADIDAVVNKMLGKQNNSRNTYYTVSAIKDNNGNPAIYVINYANNEGFLLLSASKTHSPILAYSDKGNFNGDPFGRTGLSLWQDDKITEIVHSTKLPSDSVIEAIRKWDSYTIDNNTIFANKKSSRTESDEYMQAMQIVLDSCLMWRNRGYNVYGVYDDFLDDAARCEEVRQEIQDGIYPLYMDYWEDLSVIVERIDTENYIQPNLLHTTWHGDVGFNSCFPILEDGNHAKVGCANIAAGQIMFKHRWPLKYEWNNMALIYGQPATSQFLYELALLSRSSFQVGKTITNLDNMCSALLQMGYAAQANNPANINTVIGNIKNGLPVFMGGHDNLNSHAWVASGYSMTHNISRTEVFYFTDADTFESRTWFPNYDDNNEFLYFNWGEAGENDGYFEIQSILPQPYPYNRSAIVNITPIRTAN